MGLGAQEGIRLRPRCPLSPPSQAPLESDAGAGEEEQGCHGFTFPLCADDCRPLTQACIRLRALLDPFTWASRKRPELSLSKMKLPASPCHNPFLLPRPSLSHLTGWHPIHQLVKPRTWESSPLFCSLTGPHLVFNQSLNPIDSISRGSIEFINVPPPLPLLLSGPPPSQLDGSSGLPTGCQLPRLPSPQIHSPHRAKTAFSNASIITRSLSQPAVTPLFLVQRPDP